MKTLLPVLIGLLCFSEVCSADVFVYKNKIKYTSSGGGGVTKNAAAGWTIMDDAGEVTQVFTFTAVKRYAVVPIKSIQTGVADAGGGKQYSFYIQSDTWTDGDGNPHIDTGAAKGLNTSLNVNGTTWSKPSSFTWSGRSVGPASSAGSPKIEESSGVFTFDKQWTETCNSNGDTIDSAAQRLVDELVQQGYQPF